jgi:hypothetical protein
MKRKYEPSKSYLSDDYSRFAGPDYLDRLSLSGTHLTGYNQRDTLIYEEICEALLNNPNVDATDIEILVDGGRVTLTGKVHDREMKRELELSLEHILGIKDVFNLTTLNEFSDVGGVGLVKNQARL